jgi:hypothetical protein
MSRLYIVLMMDFPSHPGGRKPLDVKWTHGKHNFFGTDEFITK